MKRFPVYDAIVIGAGISGSNIASRLAQAGMTCLLLEPAITTTVTAIRATSATAMRACSGTAAWS